MEKSEWLRRKWSKVLSKVELHLDQEKLAPYQLSSDTIPASIALMELRIELVSVIEFDASWEPTAKGLEVEDLIDEIYRLVLAHGSEPTDREPKL